MELRPTLLIQGTAHAQVCLFLMCFRSQASTRVLVKLLVEYSSNKLLGFSAALLVPRKCIGQRHAGVRGDVIKSGSSSRSLQEESGGYPSPGAQQIRRMLDAGTSRLNLTTWPNNPNRLGAHKTIFCRPISIRGLLVSGHNEIHHGMNLVGRRGVFLYGQPRPQLKGQDHNIPKLFGTYINQFLIRR